MPEQGPDHAPAPRTTGARTLCHICHGDGFVVQPTAAVIGDQPVAGGTINVPKPCQPCEGRGWLSGLVIPV